MKKYLIPFGILILIYLFSGYSYGKNYRSPAFASKNPIFAHILEVSPKINVLYAYKLSNIIAKYTRKYKIDSGLFIAILRQESNFNMKAKGKRCGLTESLEEVCIFQDYGIGQIYYKTARSYKFDLLLVLTDLDYSVKTSAIVLKDFQKRFAKKDKDWWTRYNCGNKTTTKRDTCQIYKKLVERYFKKENKND